MLRALRNRLTYYAVFAVAFAGLYTGVVVGFGEFPAPLLFGLLGVALLKDLVDEWRLRSGEGPLAFARLEHTPSNAVLLGFLLTGVVAPDGRLSVPRTDLSVSLWALAVALAAGDLLLDLSQDYREA